MINYDCKNLSRATGCNYFLCNYDRGLPFSICRDCLSEIDEYNKIEFQRRYSLSNFLKSEFKISISDTTWSDLLKFCCFLSSKKAFKQTNEQYIRKYIDIYYEHRKDIFLFSNKYNIVEFRFNTLAISGINEVKYESIKDFIMK